MTTDRKFCRFNRGPALSSGVIDDSPMTLREVPYGGLCLSSFLVILDKQTNKKVLMGKLNPKARWDHIGALDPPRVAVHSRGWMLPSSHLILYESPQEAAKRILKEQLNIDEMQLSEPKVISEVYTPKRFSELDRHWDLEFIFRGELDSSQNAFSEAWIALEFLDLEKHRNEVIARSHEDILRFAGVLA
jgi:ADP-ribose pyrophosphatase YjhB (NUDIX family)